MCIYIYTYRVIVYLSPWRIKHIQIQVCLITFSWSSGSSQATQAYTCTLFMDLTAWKGIVTR